MYRIVKTDSIYTIEYGYKRIILSFLFRRELINWNTMRWEDVNWAGSLGWHDYEFETLKEAVKFVNKRREEANHIPTTKIVKTYKI